MRRTFEIRDRRTSSRGSPAGTQRRFFFEHVASEEGIGHPDQEIELSLPQDFLPQFANHPAEIAGVPSVRFDLFLKEPLHARGVFGRTALPQRAPNLFCNGARRIFELN
jgi:hypothetical protein